MSQTIDPRVVALRHAFDRAFASPTVSHRAALHHLLLVRVGADGYALRASDIAALAQDRKIVHVPSGMPALLGLCGFRGDTLPVFSLAALLGQPRQTARWIVVCARGQDALGLAFDALDGYGSIEPTELHPLEPRPHALLGHSARVQGAPRAVIDVPAILDLVVRQQAELRRSKEP